VATYSVPKTTPREEVSKFIADNYGDYSIKTITDGSENWQVEVEDKVISMLTVEVPGAVKGTVGSVKAWAQEYEFEYDPITVTAESIQILAKDDAESIVQILGCEYSKEKIDEKKGFFDNTAMCIACSKKIVAGHIWVESEKGRLHELCAEVLIGLNKASMKDGELVMKEGEKTAFDIMKESLAKPLDPDTAKLLEDFIRIKHEFKIMEAQKKEMSTEIRELFLQIEDRMATFENKIYKATIVVQARSDYKGAFEYLLEKVNERTRNVALRMVEETKVPVTVLRDVKLIPGKESDLDMGSGSEDMSALESLLKTYDVAIQQIDRLIAE
jgi:hypothetical protein